MFIGFQLVGKVCGIAKGQPFFALNQKKSSNAQFRLLCVKAHVIRCPFSGIKIFTQL
jgi:hypothetical protein